MILPMGKVEYGSDFLSLRYVKSPHIAKLAEKGLFGQCLIQIGLVEQLMVLGQQNPVWFPHVQPQGPASKFKDPIFK